MTDFFGDDFTAELKAYFLDSLVKETEKFIDLVDETTWKKIHLELVENTKVWAIDAKTNEFLYFEKWLEDFEERNLKIQSFDGLIAAIESIKKYAESLHTEKDSLDLASRFESVVQSRKQSQFLHCRFGTQEFAIPLISIVEIIGNLRLFNLPQKREGILGVIPVRGEAIPVISFSDHGFVSAQLGNNLFVICEHEGSRFSLPVTKTEDLVNLSESDFLSAEEQGILINASFVKSFFIKDNKNIMVLDLGKLVAS
nr:hypothetical protein HAGR004_40830 [Bdellovibrio sp. HAGR004]